MHGAQQAAAEALLEAQNDVADFLAAHCKHHQAMRQDSDMAGEDKPAALIAYAKEALAVTVASQKVMDMDPDMGELSEQWHLSQSLAESFPSPCRRRSSSVVIIVVLVGRYMPVTLVHAHIVEGSLGFGPAWRPSWRIWQGSSRSRRPP